MSRKNEYTATAGQTDFTITFPYIEDGNGIIQIQLYRDDVATGDKGGGGAEGWEFIDDTTIRLNVAASLNEVILFKRETTATPIVTWTVGSKITKSDLDKLNRQCVYIAEEAIDDASLIEDYAASAEANAAASALSATTADTRATAAESAEANAAISAAQAAISAAYKPAAFGSVADMVSNIGLQIGDIAITDAYYDGIYGGGGTYEIVAAGTGTADGGSYIDLSTYQAKLIPDIFVTARQFGAVGDDSTDDTVSLKNAYTYAKGLTNKKALYIDEGKYRFSSQLLWDGGINVIGFGPEKVVLKKNGNFNGIQIKTDYSVYSGFLVDSLGGTDASVGLQIENGNLSLFENIVVTNQGSHGIWVRSCTTSNFRKIGCRFNGGTGFICQAGGSSATPIVNANDFNNIDCLGNADHGFWLTYGNVDYNTGTLIICQQNGKHGAFIESINNKLSIYGEVNDQDDTGTGQGTYRDIYMSSTSVRNLISVIFATADAALYNAGTNNIFQNFGTNGAIHATNFTPRTQGPNIAGAGVAFGGGKAGSGASGMSGGNAQLFGGDAAGTTGNGNGGDVFIYGGTPVNSGRYGYVLIDSAGNSTTVIGASSPTTLGAILELQSTTKAFLLPRMTTAQRDAIVNPQNGMMIYNTSTGFCEARRTGTWASI